MTKILREIIGGKEPTFSARIQQLESLTGKRTIDIELTAEMLGKLSDITKRMELDPLDTTSEELYAALVLKAREHDGLLRNSYHSSINELLRKLNHHVGLVPVPVIKQSRIRTVIGEVPPKKVMALLGYRSTASLLKRADLNQVLVGAFLHESVTWHRAFAKKIKQSTLSDVTLSEPIIVAIDKRLMKNVKHQALASVQLAGVVGVDISNLNRPYGWLEFTARAADGLFYLHQRGVYLKLHRFQPKIVKLIIELSYISPAVIAKLATVRIPWSTVYNYISNNINDVNFSPDGAVEQNDFIWQGAVEMLRNIHQQLEFWKSTRLIAKPTEHRPVSLNLSDIAFNALNEVSYLERSHSSIARLSLDELLSRYFKYSNEKDEILRSVGI